MGGMSESESKGGGVPPKVLAAQLARAESIRKEVEGLPIGGRPLVLEFGCGHGHWLTSYAEAFTDVFCLGVDLISARVRKGNGKRDRRGLNNLHFIKAEAAELLSVWPDDIPISQAFMLFPDPWPKKRHFKNRMIQPAFLSQLAARMPLDAPFHFRTDHPDYFSWTSEHISEHPDWQIEVDAPWPWESTSYFQEFMEEWQSLVAHRA
mgnify:CR=1 FL=1|jgi:tRNA (guanine-N7-)-methyltransferase|tara:strand:+ start:2538 stop:3158 length:621 start_codon:yes stop_codon:yes gene_type:complete